MIDTTMLYKGSFFIVALIVTTSALIFNEIETHGKRRHNRIFAYIMLDVMISAIGNTVHVVANAGIFNPILAEFFVRSGIYIYFVSHTLLAPLFYTYVFEVCGVFYKNSNRSHFGAMLPCVLTEIFVVINPITNWVWYCDNDLVFHREWGEGLVYFSAALYFIMSAVYLLFYWKALTKQKKRALIFSFVLALTGVLIQMFFQEFRVELMFESLGFVGLLLTVEKEDGRLDVPTGLYNSFALKTDLGNYFRIEKKFYVLCVRITNLDIVQKVTGHNDTEKLCGVVASYLKTIHNEEEIYRVGEAAFMLVCFFDEDAQVRELVSRIQERFDGHWSCDGVDVRLEAVTLCVGVPEYMEDADEVMLLVDGEINALQEKNAFFDEELSFLTRNADIAETLLRGIDPRNLEVRYHPGYDWKNKALCVAEAIIILNDEKLGRVMQNEFLPIAQANGLLDQFTLVMIEEVLRFSSSGIPGGLGLINIGVPVSAPQCMDGEFWEKVRALLKKYKVGAEVISLMVYDLYLVEEDMTAMVKSLETLREEGFGFVLDQYGAGYSNLQSLSAFKFDAVTFYSDSGLMNTLDLETGRAVMRNSINTVHQLGFGTIIKHVDTEEDIKLLDNDLGIDVIQGRYYSEPLTQTELIGILRATDMSRREEQKAKAQSEAKSSFLANMSHEIRTPINAILGMNEMILRESSEKNILEYAADIERAGNSLMSLINDILDFSKIEAGSMEIVESEYELSSVIHDVTNMIHGKMENKGLKLNLDIDSTLPENLYGDEMRFRQVLINILNNAVKYTDEGSITLRVSQIDGPGIDNVTLICDIIDTGAGIREEDIGKLFDKFQRVDLVRNKTVEGTGLGLAITYNLLSLMNGSIDVKSKYGHGSTFTIRLPQKVAGVTQIGDFEKRFRTYSPVRETYHESFRAPEARILAVDDTVVNLTVIAGLLKKTGVVVDKATSGRECLEMIKDTKYDIIFLDYRMPEMDGSETLVHIRESSDHLNVDTPVIVLTANAIAGARERFMAEGFDDYLTKPIDSSKLENMMITHLPREKVILAGNEEGEGEEDESDFIHKLHKIPYIDTETGIMNCGDAEGYEEALSIYFESLPEKKAQIQRYYEENDFKNYTIQVHALKSTSRLCGIADLGDLAERLEYAGDAGDMAVINEDTPRAYDYMDIIYEDLSRVFEALQEESTGGGEPISDEALADGYQALREFADAMDFDGTKFILEQLMEYDLKEEDRKKVNAIKDSMNRLDWDAVMAVLDEGKEGAK